MSAQDWEQPVACLDMAGTTVSDGGAVNQAFEAGLDAGGIGPDSPRRPEAMTYVAETMGQSKLEVFTHLLGDAELAETALAAFEARWDALLREGAVTALPGAEDAIAGLRRAGWKVALLTGFPASVRDALVHHLGWSRVADAYFCPAEAGRGRPWGDMVWASATTLGASSMRAVSVVGDTTSDMASGRRAGAGTVIGVLSGAARREELERAGATHVVGTIVEAAEVIVSRRPD
ncbi:MAG TPA: HAD family hydrolase [Acidimicrobiales bacterium]|nr:HAD family hydrolase [Acidimicrobiales bacterium]